MNNPSETHKKRHRDQRKHYTTVEIFDFTSSSPAPEPEPMNLELDDLPAAQTRSSSPVDYGSDDEEQVSWIQQ